MARKVVLETIYTKQWFVITNRNEAHKIATGHIANRWAQLFAIWPFNET
jgi:hypothetical protein